MSDPEELRHAVRSLDAAFESLYRTVSDTPTESVLRGQLDQWILYMYRLREFRVREAVGKTRDKTKYFETVVASSFAGRTTEGLVIVRNSLEHAMAAVRPMTLPLLPGDRVFPSEYLFVGSNLTWLHPDAMDEDTRREVLREKRNNYYEADLAGQAVLPSLALARQFLVSPGPTGGLTLEP